MSKPPLQGAALGKALHAGKLNYRERLSLIDDAEAADTKKTLFFEEIDQKEYDEFLSHHKQLILEEALQARDLETCSRLIKEGTELNPEYDKEKYLGKETRDFYHYCLSENSKESAGAAAAAPKHNKFITTVRVPEWAFDRVELPPHSSKPFPQRKSAPPSSTTRSTHDSPDEPKAAAGNLPLLRRSKAFPQRESAPPDTTGSTHNSPDKPEELPSPSATKSKIIIKSPSQLSV